MKNRKLLPLLHTYVRSCFSEVAELFHIDLKEYPDARQKELLTNVLKEPKSAFHHMFDVVHAPHIVHIVSHTENDLATPDTVWTYKEFLYEPKTCQLNIRLNKWHREQNKWSDGATIEYRPFIADELEIIEPE